MVKSKNVTTKRLAADISSPNGIFRKIATIFMQLQGLLAGGNPRRNCYGT